VGVPEFLVDHRWTYRLKKMSLKKSRLHSRVTQYGNMVRVYIFYDACLYHLFYHRNRRMDDPDAYHRS